MSSDREYLGVEPRPGADPDEIEEQLYDGVVFDGWSDRMNGCVAVASFGLVGQGTVGDRLESVAGSVDRALHVEYASEPGVHAGHFYARPEGELEVVETIGGERFSLRAVTDYFKREYGFDGLR